MIQNMWSVTITVHGGHLINTKKTDELGATLAGAVYGDHCSPISDTTILASTGAACKHIRHVETQLPYATLVASICAIGYVITGFMGAPWIAIIIESVLLVGAIMVLSRLGDKLFERKRRGF
ncbi:Na+/H+ antiporter NhaC family protein [Butyrivibrio sp. AC2005]|uniref:Na+/H+ antiporter NhaC family protein n=1 Tax=Butyrivibrio sp. AC2005 TaxID=1280672 RepID=UPI0003F871E0|nr:Na+/H+ antiporter NhaC family protein [Butyrivibrio sp. AC2005]